MTFGALGLSGERLVFADFCFVVDGMMDVFRF
jgi:hypothetical protein